MKGFIGSFLFLLMAHTVYAGNGDVKVNEVRKVEAFSSIKFTTGGSVRFRQADTYSFKIEGKEKLVKNTESSVKEGCLLITNREKKKVKLHNDDDGVTIWISAPDLRKVLFTGVGEFCCEEPLKLEAVSLNMNGVGEMKVADLKCHELKVVVSGVGDADIHVECDDLSARMNGVGEITLSGSAKRADISSHGIGDVDKDKLKIGD